MKAFWLPLSVLGLLLGLSLLNGSVIGRHTEQWVNQVQQAESAAAEENWDRAEQLLASLYDDWSNRQTYLHIVEVHGELDAAETALLRAIACAQVQDATEFLCETRELTAQFRLLAEMERLNIKNIL